MDIAAFILGFLGMVTSVWALLVLYVTRKQLLELGELVERLAAAYNHSIVNITEALSQQGPGVEFEADFELDTPDPEDKGGGGLH